MEIYKKWLELEMLCWI